MSAKKRVWSDTVTASSQDVDVPDVLEGGAEAADPPEISMPEPEPAKMPWEDAICHIFAPLIAQTSLSPHEAVSVHTACSGTNAPVIALKACGQNHNPRPQARYAVSVSERLLLLLCTESS